MLRDEYGMIVPGCLLSVIHGRSGRQPFLDEPRRMFEDFIHPFTA